MSAELPAIGKISPEVFAEHIFPHLGTNHPEILFGPQSGGDVGVVRVSDGRVMATTTDPVFVVPQYGWSRAAWFAVHIIASDAATSGLTPSLMTVDLNLPLSMATEDFVAFWKAFATALANLDLAVLSGHTGRYQGTDFPMVGGATVIAVGPEDRYVTPNMARPGDALLCTKGAAIESTALLAATFPEYIRRQLGDDVYRAADALFEQMSVVEDARWAASVGVRDAGVSAMHDATECGVIGGVYEIAECSRLGVELVEEEVIIRPEVQAVSRLAGIDPLTAISEGTLLITCRQHAVQGLLRTLSEHGLETRVIGRMLPYDQGRWRIRPGLRQPLVHPRVDPFWAALGRAAEEWRA